MKKESIIVGTLILTVATTITRLIGFVFRIYLANVLGAEGMGLFQLILSFYILMITLATAGIRTAVSRLVAEEIALKHYANAKRTLTQSIALSILTGTVAALLMYYFADFIGKSILNDDRTVLSLIYLAPTLPLIAVSSCYKGYFYAVNKVTQPSVVQVVEQLVRIFVIFAIMNLYLPKGLEYGCAVVSIGMCAEEIFSLAAIWIFFKLSKKPYSFKKNKEVKGDNMIPKMLNICLPLSGASILNSVLRTVENVLIPAQLILYGASVGNAMSLYGIIKGMVLPLLFFPSSFLTSLASILIPNIASDNVTSNEKKVTRTLSRVLHFTALSGILVVSLFLSFPQEIAMSVYKDPLVGYMLKIISFVCPFMYMNMVISSMLHALGEQVSTFKINMIESALKISIIYFFVPKFGFDAYLFSLFLTTILNTILYLFKLLQVSCIVFDISNWIFKPLAAAFIASVASKFLFSLFIAGKTLYLFPLISAIIILCLLYLMFLILFKSIHLMSFKELKHMLKS